MAKQDSPLKLFGSRRRKREQRRANKAFNQQLGAYEDFDVSQNIYENFQNVYAGAENVYAGAENVYEGMENTFEDLRVDTTGAELAGAQFAQSQADQLAALGGGVGGSGFGALTTTLGRQAAQQSAQTQASISQQVRQNEMAKAQGAANIQQSERAGAAEQQRLILSGAAEQQRLRLSGAAQQQQMRFAGRESAFARELAKQQELLGMAAGRKQAADKARAQNTSMWMGLAGNVLGFAGSFFNPTS